MKSIFFIFAFSLLLSVTSKAQYGTNYNVNYNVIYAMDYFRIEQMTEGGLTNVLTTESIEGSPYLSDDFTTGTIYTTNGYKVIDIPIRYNIYNDDLEFKTAENKILAIAKPETIIRADFGTYQMSYRNYMSGQKEKSGYFVVVEEGKATLLTKPQVFFQKEEPGDGIKPGKSAKFVSQGDLIFISLNQQCAVRINKKKDVYEGLKTHTKELEAFVKENHLKITKTEDLQQLIKYYNSL